MDVILWLGPAPKDRTVLRKQSGQDMQYLTVSCHYVPHLSVSLLFKIRDLLLQRRCLSVRITNLNIATLANRRKRKKILSI